jgi:hypothetical protein
MIVTFSLPSNTRRVLLCIDAADRVLARVQEGRRRSSITALGGRR